MIPSLECRLRASECERMARKAHNAPVRDILLDMARTWTGWHWNRSIGVRRTGLPHNLEKRVRDIHQRN